MDTLSAFSMRMANKGEEMMVFDWYKAVELIKKYNIKEASAGLQSDWEYTGGKILEGGKPFKSEIYERPFLASTWAVPELQDDDTYEVYECYKMESEVNGWDADTYWPDPTKEMLEK